MRIGIIGAGFAGLSAAKVLREFGHDPTVFELAPDVGGVWSRTRRYPGLETQNNRDSYCLSDFPMPKHYPEWPKGEQVQAYLASYVEHFGLAENIHLSTEVAAASLTGEGWELSTVNNVSGTDTTRVDYLVVANGIYCYPLIPTFTGADEYHAAGGRICHSSEFHDLEDARGKHVVVVGYGKSACDVAGAISDVAASTTVVARELLWKVPKRVGKVLYFKYLLLTRMGEALFPYIRRRGVERFLHGPGEPLRRAMVAGVQAVIAWQFGLKRLGLVPEGSFEVIARANVSLVTDDFYEKVGAGTIVVHRDTLIERVGSDLGRPVAVLSDGSTVPADAVVCGTGWVQQVPFFSEELQRKLTDERGNFELYRQIQPLEVPRLSFCGYNSSFFSPLSAEVAALWIAAFLGGAIELPPVEQQRVDIQERLRWMEQRTNGHHARGTNVIPFSMHNVDEMLQDLGIDVPAATRAREWLLPINPLAYGRLPAQLRKRLAARDSAQPSFFPPPGSRVPARESSAEHAER
jgi:cation diffusion facilitator CzcD-associated flavoprotein CzcO